LHGGALEASVQRLKYWRYDRGRAWVPATLADFTASDDPRVATVVFVHGNRIEHGEAFTRGWIAYRRLVRWADERPVRFVVWSWPSAKICGPLADARIKASRTDAHSYYLAWFLDHLHPAAPVSLWGHSFGARVATGSLHLLGGGTLAGRRLARRTADSPRPMQAVLVAAALDKDWLLMGRRHGKALSQVDDLLLVNNGCDRLLKRYHRLYCRRSCQEALGYVGLAVGRLPAATARKIRQLDACCFVGKQHQFANYLDAPRLMARIRAHLLFDSQPATMRPAADVAAQDVAGPSGADAGRASTAGGSAARLVGALAAAAAAR
jgi:hypothetical protein